MQRRPAAGDRAADTRHVGRHQSPTRATVYGCTSCGHTARARRPARALHSQWGAADPSAPRQRAGGRRRCRRCACSAATRRLTTARAPRCAIASTSRRAPRRRCRPARRPLSRPLHVPCECTTCRYLRRTESRTGSNQTTARDVRPAAGRRGQSTHEGSLEAAARLPVRLARGIHACICKQQHRDASLVSAGWPPGVAGARQVAREHSREQRREAADSGGSHRARRGGSGGERRTEGTCRAWPN